jgi:hypothetical protein
MIECTLIGTSVRSKSSPFPWQHLRTVMDLSGGQSSRSAADAHAGDRRGQAMVSYSSVRPPVAQLVIPPGAALRLVLIALFDAH